MWEELSSFFFMSIYFSINVVQLLLKLYDLKKKKKFKIMQFILIIDIIFWFGVLNWLCRLFPHLWQH